MHRNSLCGIMTLIVLIMPVVIYSEETLPDPNFKIQFRPDGELDAENRKALDPTNPWLAEDCFLSTTSRMFSSHGVSITGHVTCNSSIEYLDVNGKPMYPKCMIGNDNEGGSIIFSFSEDFISKNNGFQIYKVVLVDCVNGFSSDPVPVYANGVDAQVPFRTWEPIPIYLSSAETLNTLTISVEQGKGIGFEEIWLYVRPVEVSVELLPSQLFSARMEADADNTYTLPEVIFPNGEDIPSTACKYSVIPLYVGPVPEYSIFDQSYPKLQLSEEGKYNLHVEINQDCGYCGSADFPFTIYPSARNFSINWGPVLNDGMIQAFPTANDGDRVRTWKDAIISGYSDDAEVYYKVWDDGFNVLSGKMNFTEQESTDFNKAFAPTATDEGVNAIPSDYKHYTARGIDLTAGNNLSVILSKNGAVSDPVNMKYSLYNVPTKLKDIGVDINESDGSIIYYDISGKPVPKPIRGNIYISVDMITSETGLIIF